jgi:hypothetical protein
LDINQPSRAVINVPAATVIDTTAVSLPLTNQASTPPFNCVDHVADNELSTAMLCSMRVARQALRRGTNR